MIRLSTLLVRKLLLILTFYGSYYQSYSQSNDSLIESYFLRHSVACEEKQYGLFLSKNNKFLFVDYGGSHLDMIFSSSFTCGNYERKNDSIIFKFVKNPTYLKGSQGVFEKEIIFCSNKFFLEDYNPDGFKYKNCIYTPSKIILNGFDEYANNSENESRLILLKYTKDRPYLFSLRGKLPTKFEKYVRSIYFNLDCLKNTMQMITFSQADTNSSLHYYNLGGMNTLDSFKINQPFTKSQKIVFKSMSDIAFFKPIEYDVWTLKDGINNGVLEVSGNYSSKWDFINKEIDECVMVQPIQEIEPEEIITDKFGRKIYVETEKTRLINRILEKTSNESYDDALKYFLNSDFFIENKKQIAFPVKGSLPDRAFEIFKLFKHFNMYGIADIYESFYVHSNVDDVKNYQIIKSKAHKYRLSKPGFNRTKTICFVDCQMKDQSNGILVFERRIDYYILKGKITNGNYVPMIIDNHVEYTPDLRNYNLFY